MICPDCGLREECTCTERDDLSTVVGIAIAAAATVGLLAYILLNWPKGV